MPFKGNGLLILGRTLPGNTIAKTFTAWSSWETVIASGIVLALQKILRKGGREGGKEGGREGKGGKKGGKKRGREGEKRLDPSCPSKGGKRKLSRWGSVDVIDACPCVCVCVDSACDTLALCQEVVTVLCRGMFDDIFPDIS